MLSGQEALCVKSLIAVINAPFTDNRLDLATQDKQRAESVQRVLEAYRINGINICAVLQNDGAETSPLRCAIQSSLPFTFGKLFAYLDYDENIAHHTLALLRLAMDFMRSDKPLEHHRLQDLFALMRSYPVFCNDQPAAYGYDGLPITYGFKSNSSWGKLFHEELTIRQEAELARARGRMFVRGERVPVNSVTLTYYFDRTHTMQCTAGEVPDGCNQVDLTDSFLRLSM